MDIELNKKLEELHQLLYSQGDIRPASAVVDELSKLLFLLLVSERNPGLKISEGRSLKDVIDVNITKYWENTSPAKDAFSEIVKMNEFGGVSPSGKFSPIWAKDEPFRVSNPSIYGAALLILYDLERRKTNDNIIDPLGAAFDVFIQGKFAHSGGLGTYLTPAPITEAMAFIACEILGDRAVKITGDPCCGTGRFLASVVLELSRRFPELSSREITGKVFGADQSSSSVSMSMVNMLAYGASKPMIFNVRDSVIDPSMKALEGTVDLILTNPPFGEGQYNDKEGIAKASLLFEMLEGRKAIDPAFAFLALCEKLLSQGGVAGVVLPDGILDSEIFKKAILSASSPVKVVGIISLPPATFSPGGTTVKTSILFLQKENQLRGENIFFAKANHVGYLKKQGKIVDDSKGNDLSAIRIGISRMLKDADLHPSVAGLLFPVPRDEVSSLNAAAFDLSATKAKAKLLSEGGVKISKYISLLDIKKKGERDGVPFISILHIDKLGMVDWQEAETYSPKTNGKYAPAGSLLVSLLNPAKFRAAVVPDRYEYVMCSSEFAVFKTIVNPHAALFLLQNSSVKAQISPLGRGSSSSRRRIKSGDVLSLIVPQLSSEDLYKVGAEVEDYYKALDKARLGLFSSYK